MGSVSNDLLESKHTTSNMPKNMVCALAYFLGGISGFGALHLKPYCEDRDVRQHAWQSILFCAAWFIGSLVVNLCLECTDLAFPTGPGGAFMLSMIHLSISICGLLAWIKQMVSAYNGEYFPIPFLSELALKLSRSDLKKNKGDQ